MSYTIGIDLGTSSLKTVIMKITGEVVAQAGRSYPVLSPQAGYMEQNPEDWWVACCESLQECLQNFGMPANEVKGIAFSGQMHGLVVLDKELKPLRPAIIHCDGRSAKQVREIESLLGWESIGEHLLNPIFTGFQFASLCWLKNNEPRNFEKIHVALAPKDYLLFRLTGELCTDLSDASATLMLDIPQQTWWEPALAKTGIPTSILPRICATTQAAGRVTRAASKATGLAEETLVCPGGGDQIMQAIGNGVVLPGAATITIGSSGQVFIPTATPVKNPNRSTHTFCGAQQGVWFVMGAMLSAGLSLKWLQNTLEIKSFKELDELSKNVAPGSNGLLFLPYLNGERTPHMRQDLSGAFLGLTLQSGVGELACSVMEGVTFALRQCLETCLEFLPEPTRFIASGGGAHSPRWLQIQADILNRPLYVSTVKEHAAVGAAIAAGVAAGLYRDLNDGCHTVVQYKPEPILPNAKNITLYNKFYRLFLSSFEANKKILLELAKYR